MNNVIIAALLAATSLYAQASDEPKKPASVAKAKEPTSLDFSKEEILQLRLSNQDMIRINKAHDIEGYQKEIQEPQQLAASIITAKCQALGIAPEKVQTECGVITGFDQTDKAINGPDGKPIMPHVYRVQPAQK